MLVILIPLLLAWLVVAAVVIAACRTAALGDDPAARALPRASAVGAVRERIVASPRSGRLATHR